MTNDSRPILTPQQRNVLEFIKEHWAYHGYMPSRREIAQHIGSSSSNAVTAHLEHLEKKGYITKGKPRVARSLRLMNIAWEAEE